MKKTNKTQQEDINPKVNKINRRTLNAVPFPRFKFKKSKVNFKRWPILGIP